VRVRGNDRCYATPHCSTFRGDHEHWKFFASINKPPVLTSICQASRQAALNVYERAFATGVDPRYVYVNFESDTIIMEGWTIHFHSQEIKDRIRSLVLVDNSSNIDEDYPPYIGNKEGDVRKFQNLKELTYVGRQWSQADGSALKQENWTRDHFQKMTGRSEGWKMPEIKYVAKGEEGSYGIVLDYSDLI
jgi:hypothetical protein